MGGGREMNRWLLFVFPLVFLTGCSSKNESTRNAGRYLYFTSDFPSGISWEIVASFTSSSNKLWCKDLSMGEGGFVQSTKTEHYVLEKSDDTLKIPLFWPNLNICNREVSDLYLDANGRHIRMPQISLLEKTNTTVKTDAMKTVPSSIAYRCKLDSLTEIIKCDAESPETDLEYLLIDTAQINRFRIDLKGF
jgi:hypothetical protein